ncbi:MAG TPA: hypothetical protein VMM12_12075 [Longimicrobiales bacterium]|nr:hypothetical protein [Longimicrobiales bacterium]
MTPTPPLVLDERAPVSVRARIGTLLADAATADFAVARIRLAALDLAAREVARVERCRVLLGTLDAATLLDAAESGPAGAAGRLMVLRSFAASGRLEVRSAGLAGWTPDFSIFRGTGTTALLGAHYFGAPYPVFGPSFTAIVEQPVSQHLLEVRFEELWRRGHDVLPAIQVVLERAHALAVESGGPGGGRDRPVPAL